MDINSTVSLNIKTAREQKKLTLDAAAKITGVSRSMLAQIEKGEANPTISVLWKIANGYKVSFTSLVDRHDEAAVVIRGESITPLIEGNGLYHNYPTFPYNDQRRFEIYRIEIEPDGHLEAQPHIAGTEEYITVFEGAAEITADGESYSLGRGDSIRFKADTPHSYRNTGKTIARMSMLIYYA